MASVTFGSITITDGSAASRTYGVAVDPNHSNNYSSLNVIMLADGSMWGGVTTLNATQLSATRTSATGSYPATGLASDTVDLINPGIALECFATGTVTVICANGMTASRTITSAMVANGSYVWPVAFTRIKTTGTTVDLTQTHVLTGN